VAEGDWRVTLELGTPEEAETTVEELRTRLSTEVDVTHDEATVHLWCNTGPEARRALARAEEVETETIALDRWDHESQTWLPLPTITDAFDEERPDEPSEWEPADTTPWRVRAKLPSRRDAVELLDGAGLVGERRWRTVTFDCAGAEEAAEVEDRIRQEAPIGTEIEAYALD
jgi:hypothetical protein